MSEKPAGILGFFAEKSLIRNEQRLKRKKTTQNIANTKSAMILMEYDTAYQTRLQALLEFFNKNKISFTIVVYLPKKEQVTTFMPRPELFPFSKKDCNWLGIPSGHELDGVLQQKPDILIEFDLSPVFQLAWISRLSNSSFKIGRGENKAHLDLIIQDPGKQDQVFIQQIIHWLQAIKTT